jgi:mannosyltransferase OCH1-like enzyme
MRYRSTRNHKLKRKQRTRRVQRGGQQEFEIPHHTPAKQVCENKTGIPFYVFQTWESRKFPKDMYTTMIENQRKNPCFEFYLFDDVESREFIEHYFELEVLKAYDSLVPGTYKADLFRYCVLYIHGGIYLDAKFKILRDLKQIFLKYKEFFLQDLLEPDVYNGIICVQPKQKYIKAMIDQVISNVKNNYYGPGPISPTACTLVKQVLTKYNLLNLIKLDFSCPKLGDTLLNGSLAGCRHQVKDSNGLLFDQYPTYRKEYEIVRNKINKKHYGDYWSEGKAGEGKSNKNKDSSGTFIKGIYKTNKIGGSQVFELPHHTPAKEICENKTDIPFYVFQTWESHTLYKDMYLTMTENQRKNPCFDFYLFDTNECRDFIKHYFKDEPDVLWAFDSLVPGAYKADLWRYCVLYIHGGIYLDASLQIIENLKDFVNTYGETYVRDSELIFKEDGITKKDSTAIWNGILISPKKTKLYDKAIKNIIENIKNNFYGATPLDPSGPRLLGNIITSTSLSNKIKIQHDTKRNDTFYNIDTNKVIFKTYPTYRSDRKTTNSIIKHYHDIWHEGNAGEGNSTLNKNASGKFIKGIYATITQ